jgi:hypothetical protein
VEPGLKRSEQNLVKIEDNDFGSFNDFGDLFLNPEDIPTIQRKYQQLYTFRMQFEAVQLQLRKFEKTQVKEFEFVPKVSDTTKEIALKYREKIEITN